MNGFRDLPGAPDFPDDDSIAHSEDMSSMLSSPSRSSRPSRPSRPTRPSRPSWGSVPSDSTIDSEAELVGVTPAIDATASALLGVDSIVSSSAAILANTQSHDYLGAPPQFWGRYFYAPGQINSSGHRDTHYSPVENAMLRAKGIRVLPIARQTRHVVDRSKAQTDAAYNVAAIFEAFPAQYLSGADPDVLVFLDTEPESPVDAQYYKIWSAGLIEEATRISNGRVRFHPAVYGNQGDDATWAALSEAMHQGAVCDGVWIARYPFSTAAPRPWNDTLVTPHVKLLCPILAWQYWASPDDAAPAFNFDATIVNAPHADMLMNRLVMPPA